MQKPAANLCHGACQLIHRLVPLAESGKSWPFLGGSEDIGAVAVEWSPTETVNERAPFFGTALMDTGTGIEYEYPATPFRLAGTVRTSVVGRFWTFRSAADRIAMRDRHGVVCGMYHMVSTLPHPGQHAPCYAWYAASSTTVRYTVHAVLDSIIDALGSADTRPAKAANDTPHAVLEWDAAALATPFWQQRTGSPPEPFVNAAGPQERGVRAARFPGTPADSSGRRLEEHAAEQAQEVVGGKWEVVRGTWYVVRGRW